MAPRLHGGVFTLPKVPAQHAIRLRARYDFQKDGVSRLAGEIWQVEGPLTYRPEPEAVSS